MILADLLSGAGLLVTCADPFSSPGEVHTPGLDHPGDAGHGQLPGRVAADLGRPAAPAGGRGSGELSEQAAGRS